MHEVHFGVWLCLAEAGLGLFLLLVLAEPYAMRWAEIMSIVYWAGLPIVIGVKVGK